MPGIGSSGPESVALALLAAFSWGGGDFSGGMGVKSAGGSTRGALRVIVAGHGMSLAGLLVFLAVQHAQIPAGAPLWWGLGAGVAAGLSLLAFYIALARGVMGSSAAISGLLAAAIPAALDTLLEGAPSALRCAGFAVAGVAIWLIAAGPAPEESSSSQTGSRLTLWLAVAGGIGFGIYFAALRFANPLGVLEPVALARCGSLGTCLFLLLVLPRGGANASGAGRWLSPRAWFWAGGIALLDTGGNLLFTAATRAGRLDVASVLASLYPASTILLAAALLKELPTPRQRLGMGVALAAVVMITV